MLTLGQFAALADSFGAELQRWPDAVRDEAAALLQESPQARARLAKARMLDEAIMAAGAEADALLQPSGGPDAALVRLRAGVAARLGSSTARQPKRWRLAWVFAGMARLPLSTNLGWVGMATGSGFAIAAGLFIGSLYAPAPPSNNVLTMLQSAPIQMLAD